MEQVVFEHVRDWVKATRDDDAVMPLSYEEMKSDLRAVAGRVARFIGVDANPALLDRVVAGSSFSGWRTTRRRT